MSILPLAFVRPEWLLLMLPPLILLWSYARLPDKSANAPGFAEHLVEALTVRRTYARWIAPLPLALLALAITGFALSGPSWQRQASPLNQQRGAVILALDASDSMRQSQGGLSPWQRALLKSRDLINAMPSSEIGIIAYAGSAHWVLPPSRDRALLDFTLAGLESLRMPIEGKYWQRIEQAVAQLGIEVDSVIVLSDIEPELSQSPWSTHGWIFGAAVADSSRSIVATPDSADVATLLSRVQRDLARAADNAEKWRDDGYIFILPLALLLLFWFRRGWSMAWSVLLVCQLLGSSPQVQADEAGVSSWWFSGDQRGRYYFQQGDYPSAAQAFEDPLWKGLSYYSGRDYALAAQQFATLDSDYGRLMLANALAQQDFLQRALAVYLAMGPDHTYVDLVAANMVAIEQRIAEREAMTDAQQTDLDQQEQRQIVDDQYAADPSQLIDSDMAEQLSGQDIINQKQLAERWMDHINTAVGDYLSALFAQQAYSGDGDD